MKERPPILSTKKKASLFERIQQILESARANVSRAVKTAQVVSYWLIGRGGLKSNALRSTSLRGK